MRKMAIFIVVVVLISCVEGATQRKEYYQNGKLKSITNFQNDEKNGEKLYFDSTGVLLSKQLYIRDTLQFEYFFYENGLVSEKIGYKHGKRHGTYLKYYPNGNLADSCYYNLGAKEGKYFQFFPDDKRVIYETYFLNVNGDDFIYYRKTFDHIGKLVDTERAIDVHIYCEPPGSDLLKVTFRIMVPYVYDSAIVSIGDYDSRFNPGSFSDTLVVIGKEFIYSKRIRDINFSFLRGRVVTFEHVENINNNLKGDSLVSTNYENYYFFEEKIIDCKQPNN